METQNTPTPTAETSLNHNAEPTAPVMSTKDWLITQLVMLVPIVNLVMLFVWGFGDTANPNKANWAKASLIFMVIGVGLYIVFFVLFFGTLAASGRFR